MTSECLRLVRKTSRLPPGEADSCLEELPARLREWQALLKDPPADSLVAELSGWEGYSLWSGSYDDDPDNRVVLAEEEHIWGMIGPVEGKRVLDAGCGSGRHTIRLLEAGATVVACEPNPVFLDMAKAKAKGLPQGSVQWLNCDIGALPESLGCFDLVLCCLVLSHVEDIRSAIARLGRLVPEGGALIVSDFHPFNLMIGWRTSFRHGGRKYVVPNFLHLPSDYFKALGQAGMAVEDFREVGDFPSLPGQPATLIMKGRKGRT